MSSTVLSENTENTCVVCFKNVSIYSIGECDHPVCYECSTRMRVLCRQNECPICRQDMPKVIFTKIVQPFKNIKNNTYLMDKKFKICFDNAEIQSAYSKLLEHVCTICPGRPAFRTFQNLKDHMRKEHELHYCDLCVDNLKIFTGERRCYTRQELAQHRRKGDPDDRSHRGHPLCEFCDQRYMDNDELFRHLRRDHLFCHFCDADGFHRYYSSYDYLRDHFRADHFLCEEGSCMDEKFTSAFRSEIDLKAHRASVHGRTMGKAAAKQARTLELEFTLAPRPRPERGGGGGGGGGRPGQRGRPARDDDHLLGAAGPAHDDFPGPGAAALAPASAAAPRTHCPDEFPTLSGAPAPPAPATAPGPLSRPNGVGGLTIRAVRQPPLAVTDENFPALGGADAAPPPAALNTVRLSVNSERAGDGLSIRVNRRADPHATRLRADDFPSLGASTGPPGGPAPAPPPASSVASGQWLHVDRRGRPRTPLAGPPQGPPPKVKSMQEDFPSLGAPASATEPRAKKASSVVIPVTPAPSWLQSNGPVHPPAAAPAPATPAAATSAKQELMGVATIKVKSKKKKQQQQPQQQQQAKNANDGGGKEAGKRKKREDASASASSKSAARSGEEEITSKLEGVLTCKESSGGGGDGRGAGHSSSSSTGSGAASAAAAAAERKRSELLIASLRPERTAPPPSPPESPPPPAIPREDFPSLGCPPGFWRPVLAAAAATAVTTSTSTTAPPPGFGAASATTTASSSTAAAAAAAAAAGPPPGFSSVTLNSVARAPAPPGGNGLTFTSSSGRSYPILPRAAPSAGAHTPSPAPAAAAAAPFVPPRDAERRNQALVARVRRVLPLDDFLQLSALFRQGALPAATFRSHCRHLLGEEAFADVFPELLALLPDIAKQQELMAAHEEEEGPGSLPIQVCASCGQVLASGDLRHHQASHHLENHFASTTLDKASTTIASAWDNRK